MAFLEEKRSIFINSPAAKRHLLSTLDPHDMPIMRSREHLEDVYVVELETAYICYFRFKEHATCVCFVTLKNALIEMYQGFSVVVCFLVKRPC